MLLALHAAFEDGCRWNVNYRRPRGWTRALFKGWAGCNLKALGWICSAPRPFSHRRPMPQCRQPFSTPFTTCITQCPPPTPPNKEWVGVTEGAYVCICFCEHSKMKGSCPQWPCVRGHFTVSVMLKIGELHSSLSARGVLYEAMPCSILHFCWMFVFCWFCFCLFHPSCIVCSALLVLS